MNQQGGGFGFNPFGFAFGGTKAAADMRSFDEILKEFEDFFTIDPKKTQTSDSSTGGKLKGRDINTSLEIDFMEAARGITKQIAFDRNEVCETGKGARTKPNA